LSCVKGDYWFSNGLFFGAIHQHCFALNSGNLQQKCMTCLKQLSVTLHWGENKLLSGFLDANMRKFWLTFQVEDSACSSHPSIAHTDGNMEQVYKIAHSDQLNSILETAG
jgi:hypothetical protein